MKRVCAGNEVVRGVDIYHGNMISDVNLLARNVSYVFLKAFEYTEDPAFQSRWLSMRRYNIIRGAYDFFHPSRDPVAQADKFFSIIGPLMPGDLPCALDWESTDNVPGEKDRAAALAWLQRIETRTGVTPIIYTGPYFADALKLDVRFKKYPLWIAHYGVTCPLVPQPWDKWTFWQTSEKGLVPGLAGASDKDVFNGTLLDLKALCKQ